MLLDEIIVAARDGGASADQIAKRFFAARRYAGSKDRRAVRDLTWSVIRRFAERPDNARAAFITMAQDDPELAALFDGSGYGPAAIDDAEARTHGRGQGGVLPQWILPHFSALVDGDEQGHLLNRAPLDIRANALKTVRDDAAALFPGAEILDASPFAFRLPTGTAIENHVAIADGCAEIQDLGSQLICDACAVLPGMTVLDLCAGAGGKTLALSALMKGSGRLIASDTNRARLAELSPRAMRAGARHVETLLLNPGQESSMLAALKGKCDLVLVDAPCSGSGTWRRNPETRWRLTPARLTAVMAQQARLMQIGAEMTVPGGHMVYAVCSLLTSEGRVPVADFLTRNTDWRSVPLGIAAGRAEGDGRLLTPAYDGSDGFFLARLQKL